MPSFPVHKVAACRTSIVYSFLCGSVIRVDLLPTSEFIIRSRRIRRVPGATRSPWQGVGGASCEQQPVQRAGRRNALVHIVYIQLYSYNIAAIMFARVCIMQH